MAIGNGDGDVGVTQLGYVGIGVSNLPAWREFAGSVLGLQENGSAADGSLFLRLDSYHHRLILSATGEDDIIYHGWEVKDAAALEHIAAKVRDHGIEVVAGSSDDLERRMVLGLIKFADPDGLATEIYYGPFIDHVRFDSPRAIAGFKAEDLGLGHIVLRVTDAAAYVRFYTEVLGARVSDILRASSGGQRPAVTFLHVNPRHHSIAVAQGRGSEQRLAHIMFEVTTPDDVGITFGLFQQRGIPVGNLGRHTNDWMFSFYGVTPSGFYSEYGYGARTIDDEDSWEVQQYRAVSIWGHGNWPKPIAAPGK